VTKDKDASNADPFLAGLVAARWVTVSEVPEDTVQAEKLKDITEPSGKFIARPLYGEALYISPMFRLGIMSNHMLNLGEKPDSGATRRPAIVPHRFEFKDEVTGPHTRKGDPNVKMEIRGGKLMPEFFGVCSSFYPGLRAQDSGLQLAPRPPAVISATEKGTASAMKERIHMYYAQFVQKVLSYKDATTLPEVKASIYLFMTGAALDSGKQSQLRQASQLLNDLHITEEYKPKKDRYYRHPEGGFVAIIEPVEKHATPADITKF
jgi:hypothetical protein